MEYKFSVIITYRHSNDRISNLRAVLDWFNGFTGCEMIIVEQDNISKIEYLDIPVSKYIFVKNDGPFNKGWGYNIGVKEATTNVLVFTDSDIIMNPSDFIAAIGNIHKYDVISPYKKVIDLTPEESILPYADIYPIDKVGRGEETIEKCPLCGGMVIFNREAFEKIGGWPEMFLGWGAEDDFQSVKIERTGIEYLWMEANCFHLWHKKANINLDDYKNNLLNLKKFKELSDDHIKAHCKNIFSSIGKITKYT